MNMKRFFSATSREAMKQVRAELGDEAVILSNREVDGGVEVIASASDDIAALIARTPTASKAGKFTASPTPKAASKMFAKASSEELAAMPTLARIAHAAEDIAAPTAHPDTRDMRNFGPAGPAGLASAVARAVPSRPAAPAASVPESFAHYIKRSEENRAAHYLELSLQRGSVTTPVAKGSRPTPAASVKVRPTVAPTISATPSAVAKPPARVIPKKHPNENQHEYESRSQYQYPHPSQQEHAPAVVAPIVSTPVAVVPAPIAAPMLTETDPRLINEIMQMKTLLQEQMGVLSWHDTTSRRPLQAKQITQMLSAGFSPALARAISEKLPADFNESAAASWLQESLIRNLAVPGEDNDMVDRGGVYALVGPTGVGKTTTAAKLAAKCVVKYGIKSLGLITIDSYRIGAEDQLRAYGKILGVPVHTARDAQSLAELIAQMRDKHLVLIDTVGMGQRDRRLYDLMQMLNSPAIERVLFLNASAQAETLEDVVRQYSGEAVQPRQEGNDQHEAQARSRSTGFRRQRKVIITKLDEAVKFGFVLDCLVRHKLEMQYVTNGQSVPEDLHPANPQYLVHRALKHRGAVEFNLNEIDIPLVFAASNAAPAKAARHV